jgi:CheY-like chemotaxis protein
MNTVRKYIIVDDDHFSSVLCSMVIKNTLGEVDTEIFIVPEEALAFIETTYCRPLEATILFLDINMPTLSGWEFMEQYERFNQQIKNQISIYIQSSSVDERDVHKASANKSIKGFISKPLDGKTILSLSSS